MHVIDDPHSSQEFKRQRHEEQQVGGIAEVNDIETATSPSFQRTAQFSPQGRHIFQEITTPSACLTANPVAVNLNAF